LQYLAQRMRSARHRRWTKRGDAKLRKPLRNRSNRIPTVERVEAIEPMNMDVDETRKHDMPPQIFLSARGAPPPLAVARRRVFDALPSGASLRPQARGVSNNVNDPFAVDDERAPRLHASRQDEIGASQDDHER
jgi:hypothetical protein